MQHCPYMINGKHIVIRKSWSWSVLLCTAKHDCASLAQLACGVIKSFADRFAHIEHETRVLGHELSGNRWGGTAFAHPMRSTPHQRHPRFPTETVGDRARRCPRAPTFFAPSIFDALARICYSADGPLCGSFA